MRDRLIELLKQKICPGPCFKCEYYDAELKRPREYCAAESRADHLLANGVIVPPCKVGDKVYMIDDYDCEPYVLDVKIDHIKIDKISVWVGLRYPLGIKHTPLVPVDDIGKTVFLTREEAEQALKGG